jgi:UDP-glucose 4-epimerase
MAISRFMGALLTGERIELHGDGEQTRDFTFVGDVVEATVRSATANVGGEVFNIGGGSRSTINGILAALEDVSGRTVTCRRLPAPAPAERHAAASINLARQRLGWEPRIGLLEGLARQWKWMAGESTFGRAFEPAAAAV